MATSEPVFATEAIQGNVLRGFSNAHLALVGLGLPATEPGARNYVRALANRLTSLRSTHALRLVRSAGLALPGTHRSFLNVGFSFPGIGRLGLPTAGIREPFFRVPMGSFAGALNDPLDAVGRPLNYVMGADWDQTPDLVLIVGADSADDLDGAVASEIAVATAQGCTFRSNQRGTKLPGDIEHFGFRDGISQVGPRGRLSAATNDYLTPRFFAEGDANALSFAKPGQPLAWPGQFVFGYANSDPDDLTVPGEPSEGGEAWMRNGSFLVYRRLRQDVVAFRAFGAATAQVLSAGLGRVVSSEEAEALLVGRWADGTPLLPSPQGPMPALAADDFRVNNFDYRTATPELTVVDGTATRTVPAVPADRGGQRCPMFSHVRKVNPRGMPTDQAGLTATFQMLRRGMPFGPLYTNAPGAERGLLFLAYMTSVDRQFRLLTAQWMNNPAAPEVGATGHDMLVGQADAGQPRQCTLKDALGNPKAALSTTERWVIPTGGAVLFAPAIDTLAAL